MRFSRLVKARIKFLREYVKNYISFHGNFTNMYAEQKKFKQKLREYVVQKKIWDYLAPEKLKEVIKGSIKDKLYKQVSIVVDNKLQAILQKYKVLTPEFFYFKIITRWQETNIAVKDSRIQAALKMDLDDLREQQTIRFNSYRNWFGIISTFIKDFIWIFFISCFAFASIYKLFCVFDWLFGFKDFFSYLFWALLLYSFVWLIIFTLIVIDLPLNEIEKKIWNFQTTSIIYKKILTWLYVLFNYPMSDTHITFYQGCIYVLMLATWIRNFNIFTIFKFFYDFYKHIIEYKVVIKISEEEIQATRPTIPPHFFAKKWRYFLSLPLIPIVYVYKKLYNWLYFMSIFKTIWHEVTTRDFLVLRFCSDKYTEEKRKYQAYPNISYVIIHSSFIILWFIPGKKYLSMNISIWEMQKRRMKDLSLNIIKFISVDNAYYISAMESKDTLSAYVNFTVQHKIFKIPKKPLTKSYIFAPYIKLEPWDISHWTYPFYYYYTGSVQDAIIKIWDHLPYTIELCFVDRRFHRNTTHDEKILVFGAQLGGRPKKTKTRIVVDASTSWPKLFYRDWEYISPETLAYYKKKGAGKKIYLRNRKNDQDFVRTFEYKRVIKSRLKKYFIKGSNETKLRRISLLHKTNLWHRKELMTIYYFGDREFSEMALDYPIRQKLEIYLMGIYRGFRWRNDYVFGLKRIMAVQGRTIVRYWVREDADYKPLEDDVYNVYDLERAMRRYIYLSNFRSYYDKIEREPYSAMTQLAIPEIAFVEHDLDRYGYERDFPIEKVYVKYGFNNFDIGGYDSFTGFYFKDIYEVCYLVPYMLVTDGYYNPYFDIAGTLKLWDEDAIILLQGNYEDLPKANVENIDLDSNMLIFVYFTVFHISCILISKKLRAIYLALYDVFIPLYCLFFSIYFINFLNYDRIKFVILTYISDYMEVTWLAITSYIDSIINWKVINTFEFLFNLWVNVVY